MFATQYGIGGDTILFVLVYLFVATQLIHAAEEFFRDKHAPMAGAPVAAPRRDTSSVTPRALSIAWLVPALVLLLGDAGGGVERTLLLPLVFAAVLGLSLGWGWLVPGTLWGATFGYGLSPTTNEMPVGVPSWAATGALIGGLFDVLGRSRAEGEREP